MSDFLVYTLYMSLTSLGGTSEPVQSTDTPIALLPATVSEVEAILDQDSPNSLSLTVHLSETSEVTYMQILLLGESVRGLSEKPLKL